MARTQISGRGSEGIYSEEKKRLIKTDVQTFRIQVQTVGALGEKVESEITELTHQDIFIGVEIKTYSYTHLRKERKKVKG